MANLLPILLLGGAAVIMMSGSKGSPKPKIEPEPEPDPEPEPEPAPEPEPEPGIVMEDRDVVCFKKTAGNVEKSLKMKDAILEEEGPWDEEIYAGVNPQALEELGDEAGSWLSMDSQHKLTLAIVEHVKTLPLHLVPQGWGLTDEAFKKNVTPVIVEALLTPCQRISSRTTLEGGAPSPENLFMDSALKLARALYIDTGIKTRGTDF